MVKALTAILVAYFIGAIPFGLLVARLFGVQDIRQVGSGNIGATNVLRTLGMRAAIWVYLLDSGKGALAVFIARSLIAESPTTELYWVLAGMAAIVGHVYPVYLHFKGGKGVATMFGVLVVLLPVETVLAALVFVLVLVLSRYVSLASMMAAISFPAVVTVEQALLGMSVSRVYWVLTLLIGCLVPLTHRQNIGRLISGTESRVKFKRRRKETDV